MYELRNKITPLGSVSAFASLIAIDQAIKHIIRHWGGFYVCNPGIAFGLKLPGSFFWVLWVGMISLLFLARYKKYFIHSDLFLALVLAGAISNLFDRLIFGCVTDFIDLRIWPVFNLADILIFLGISGIIFENYRKKS